MFAACPRTQPRGETRDGAGCRRRSGRWAYRTYGCEENEGGSPNLGESAPFNYTVQLGRFDQSLNPINTFAMNPWFPGGLPGGYAQNTLSLPAPVTFIGFATD